MIERYLFESTQKHKNYISEYFSLCSFASFRSGCGECSWYDVLSYSICSKESVCFCICDFDLFSPSFQLEQGWYGALCRWNPSGRKLNQSVLSCRWGEEILYSWNFLFWGILRIRSITAWYYITRIAKLWGFPANSADLNIVNYSPGLLGRFAAVGLTTSDALCSLNLNVK